MNRRIGKHRRNENAGKFARVSQEKANAEQRAPKALPSLFHLIPRHHPVLDVNNPVRVFGDIVFVRH
jgi:hypothetical protein